MARLESRLDALGKRHRRLSLLDTMVMIAATALGILPARWTFGQHQETKFSNAAQRVVYAANDFLPPLLVAWSLAGLILGLVRHRLSRRALARHPGFVACLIAFLLTVYSVATSFMSRAVRTPDQIGQHYLNLHFTLSDDVGPAIAGAWLVQALIGCRFFRSTGVEFLGCLVGLGWVGMFFVTTMLPWLTILAEGR
jgi:hypothetical protein